MPPIQTTLNTVVSGQVNSAAVNIFTNADCTTPFQLPGSSATVVTGTCYIVPQSSIRAVSISTRGICADDEELVILLSKESDCSTPLTGIPIDSRAIDTCQPFTSGIDCSSKTEQSEFKSVKIVCRPINGEGTETNILESPPPRRGKRGNDVSVGVNAHCCTTGCVVM